MEIQAKIATLTLTYCRPDIKMERAESSSKHFDAKKKETSNDMTDAVKARWDEKRRKVNQALLKQKAAVALKGLTQKHTSLPPHNDLQLTEKTEPIPNGPQNKKSLQNQLFAQIISPSKMKNAAKSTPPLTQKLTSSAQAQKTRLVMDRSVLTEKPTTSGQAKYDAQKSPRVDDSLPSTEKPTTSAQAKSEGRKFLPVMEHSASTERPTTLRQAKYGGQEPRRVDDSLPSTEKPTTSGQAKAEAQRSPKNRQQHKSEAIGQRPMASPRKKSSSPPLSARSNREIERDFTPEQLMLVNFILHQKTDAEVLNVSPSANITEINKAFKKLVLKLHPDKNPAPGATAAFLRIQKAAKNMRSARAYEGLRPEFYNNAYYRRENDNSDNEAGAHNDVAHRITFCVLIFLLIALGISYFFASGGGIYRMEPNGRFIVPRTTSRYQLTYYVSEDFEREMRGVSIRDLETKIEVDFASQKRLQCKDQRTRHMQELLQARRANLMEKYQHLLHKQQPACDELIKFSLSRQSLF